MGFFFFISQVLPSKYQAYMLDMSVIDSVIVNHMQIFFFKNTLMNKILCSSH